MIITKGENVLDVELTPFVEEVGVLQGYILNSETKAVIPGATISVDGFYHTTSEGSGAYRTGLLYFGMHIITVAAGNFQTAEFVIDLQEGTMQRDFELEPLPEPPPGPVKVDEIVVDPVEVVIGDRVSIRVCLMGPYPDVYPRPYTIVVTVGGETLTADVEMRYRNPCFPLPYYPPQVGSYTAVSGGKSAHFECVAPPPPPPQILPDDAIEALPLYCDWHGRKADSCGGVVHYSEEPYFEYMGVTAYCEKSCEAVIARPRSSCGQSKTIESCSSRVNCGKVSQHIPGVVGGKALIILRNQPTDDWTAHIHSSTFDPPFSFRALAQVSGSGTIIRFEGVPFPPDHYVRTLFLTISFTNGEVWCSPGALCFPYENIVTPAHRLAWEEYYYEVDAAQLQCARANLINYVTNPFTVSSAVGQCLAYQAARLGLNRNYQYLSVWEIENGYQNKLQLLNASWYDERARWLQLKQELDANWSIV